MSLDDSGSDSQSEASAITLSAARWLSGRFHFNADPVESSEEDVFDVNQWPTFAPVATTIGINKQRFLFSSPRTRLLSLNPTYKNVLDNPVQKQEIIHSDTEMEESHEMLSTNCVEPQAELLPQDIVMEGVSCMDEMMKDNLCHTIEPPSPSTSSELERLDGTSNDTLAESVRRQNQTQSGINLESGSAKAKRKKMEGFGGFGPVRRMIQSASIKKQATANNEAEDDVDDDIEGVTRFSRITTQEKRRRQAKRAEQLKFWRVREERDAREARIANRRQLEGRSPNAKHAVSNNEPATTATTLRKAVKFNLKRNRVIQFDDRESQ